MTEESDRELDKAFVRFENAVAAYWQWDRDKSISPRQLRALQGAANKARAELLRLIKGR